MLEMRKSFFSLNKDIFDKVYGTFIKEHNEDGESIIDPYPLFDSFGG